MHQVYTQLESSGTAQGLRRFPCAATTPNATASNSPIRSSSLIQTFRFRSRLEIREKTAVVVERTLAHEHPTGGREPHVGAHDLGDGYPFLCP
jgi:hypothetical protein